MFAFSLLPYAKYNTFIIYCLHVTTVSFKMILNLTWFSDMPCLYEQSQFASLFVVNNNMAHRKILIGERERERERERREVNPWYNCSWMQFKPKWFVLFWGGSIFFRANSTAPGGSLALMILLALQSKILTQKNKQINKGRKKKRWGFENWSSFRYYV